MKMVYEGHQGDVCIFSLDQFPGDQPIRNKQTENAILAYGEASGHAHQFEDMSSVDVFRNLNNKFDGLFFVKPKANATLVHGRARDFIGQEADRDYHNPITLFPNKKYATGIPKETDWINKVVRRVVD